MNDCHSEVPFGVYECKRNSVSLCECTSPSDQVSVELAAERPMHPSTQLGVQISPLPQWWPWSHAPRIACFAWWPWWGTSTKSFSGRLGSPGSEVSRLSVQGKWCRRFEAEASEISKHPAPAPQSDMQGPVSTLAKVRGEKKPRPGWIRKSTEMVEMPIAYMQDLVVQRCSLYPTTDSQQIHNIS